MDLTATPDGLQRPLGDFINRSWDVVVIGAGPAGAVVACSLAEKGHQVLLLDKAKFPRDKTCGDALIPDALNVLDRLGLLEAVKSRGHAVGSISVFSPSRIEISIPGDFITLKRRCFDYLLAEAAVKRGAVFCQGAVSNIRVEADGTSTVAFADGPHSACRARIVIIATGANLQLLRPIGMATRIQPSAMALRCYVHSSHIVEQLVISYDRTITPGYAWIFPLGSGEYNVGCGVFYRNKRHRNINLRCLFDKFLAEFPVASELMRHATSSTPVLGAPLRCSLTGAQVAKGTVLAIGESIGATFPLTGEGIGKAMETAEIAADAVHRTLATGASRHLRLLPLKIRTDLLPRYVGYEIGESWLSYPWLNDVIAWRVKRSRSCQKIIAGIVNETVDPRRLFSVIGLIKSLWR